MVQQRLAAERVAIKEELQREMQRERVLEAHPDFDDVRTSAEFKDWFVKQPDDWKAKYGNTWAPSANITVMDTYKKSKVTPTPAPDVALNARKEAIKNATNPRGSGPAPKPGPISDDDQFDLGYKTG